MAKPASIVLNWQLKPVAAAMQVTEADVRSFFKLPGSASALAKMIVVRKFTDWQRAAAKASWHDYVDAQGKRWKFRSIAAGGLRFNTSKHPCAGDRFNETGFQRRLGQLEGFVLADIPTFPKIAVHPVTAKTLRRWSAERRLSPSTHVGRKKLLRMLREED